MTKKIFGTMAVVAAMFAGYSTYNAQNERELTGLALANVEALANGETHGEEFGCFVLIVSPTYDELVKEPEKYPLVYDCEPCGNIVFAKEATNGSTCTKI